MINWQDKQEVKKGNLGEQVIDDYLKSLGVIPYKPDKEGPHPFDRLCATANKKEIYVAEVKTKHHRNLYPDTGFNYSVYLDYKNIMSKYGIDVFVYFVDEGPGEYGDKIYGNKLSELEKPTVFQKDNIIYEYPKIEKNRFGKDEIYFPLVNVKIIAKLNQSTAKALRDLSNRNYPYQDEAAEF